jgi:hypothetical protein
LGGSLEEPARQGKRFGFLEMRSSLTLAHHYNCGRNNVIRLGI